MPKSRQCSAQPRPRRGDLALHQGAGQGGNAATQPWCACPRGQVSLIWHSTPLSGYTSWQHCRRPWELGHTHPSGWV